VAESLEHSIIGYVQGVVCLSARKSAILVRRRRRQCDDRGRDGGERCELVRASPKLYPNHQLQHL